MADNQEIQKTKITDLPTVTKIDNLVTVGVDKTTDRSVQVSFDWLKQLVDDAQTAVDEASNNWTKEW